MRNIFQIRRNPGAFPAGSELKWYGFVALNLPISLYFGNKARKEIRENRMIEDAYL